MRYAAYGDMMKKFAAFGRRILRINFTVPAANYGCNFRREMVY